MRRVGGVLAVGLALGAVVLAFGAMPAAATTCTGTLDVQRALGSGDPVFVGTVVSTTNEGTWATFAIDEVWAGEVPDGIEVKTDTKRGKYRSVGLFPVTFEPGAQYLVMPHKVEESSDSPISYSDEGDYEVPLCVETPIFTVSIAALRPAHARIIEREQPVEIIGAVPMATDDGPPWLAIGGAAVIVFGSVALSTRRRHQRRPVDIEPDESFL